MARRKWRKRSEPEAYSPPGDSFCWVVAGGVACMAPAVATYAPVEKPSVYISVCEAHRKPYDSSAGFTRTAQFKPREENR